jgi:hypothetical protein
MRRKKWIKFVFFEGIFEPDFDRERQVRSRERKLVRPWSWTTTKPISRSLSLLLHFSLLLYFPRYHSSPLSLFSISLFSFLRPGKFYQNHHQHPAS